ncbi:MAG: hypothetical protein JXR70_01360 [Spirochaetales bacterium]|nr:hypothetical protein [Spirochaetales bacterium]
MKKDAMKNISKEIKDQARDFMPIEAINDFISLISPWEDRIQSFFFQIKSGETPTLEFGAHLGKVVVDLTYSQNQHQINHLTLSTLDWLQRTETGQYTALSLNSGGSQALLYQAEGSDSRQRLKDYATHLENILGDETKWK